jgi:phospholipid-binding lipoprotein MlaA
LLGIAVVVVVLMADRTSTLGATMSASEATRDNPYALSRRHIARLVDSGDPLRQLAMASWMAGNTDANIPPEALQWLATQHLSGEADYAQAPVQSDGAPSNEDALENDEFDDEFLTEYDPWEGFNRAMFGFNRQVDRFVLKPVATAWNTVVPELAQQSLSNAFDNLAMPRRFVNNLFQLKIERAGRELARFFLNTTMGVLGFFDAASDLGLPKISDEDTGQTFGHYGVGPGPYLVLPFLPPLTVRDAFGFAGDVAMAPLGYVIPFDASAGMRGGQIVNERSLNLDFFDQLERETFDLYTAVRNAYLQRRQRALED